MRQLIVNGDDFGLTPGVNAGIVRSFQEGILRSATLMANGLAWQEAVELARANPGLGVGCHLVLVGGQAVAPTRAVDSLADGEGRLPRSLWVLLAKLTCGAIRQQEIAREFRAQVERVCQAGLVPSHLDTHKHTHAHPRVMEALASVAAEFGIYRVRKPFEGSRRENGRLSNNGKGQYSQRAKAFVAKSYAPRFHRIVQERGLRTPDHFYGLSMTGHLGLKSLLGLLESLRDGTSELMCHPGMSDSALERAPTRLKREREREVLCLTHPDVSQRIAAREIYLISYLGLK